MNLPALQLDAAGLGEWLYSPLSTPRSSLGEGPDSVDLAAPDLIYENQLYSECNAQDAQEQCNSCETTWAQGDSISSEELVRPAWNGNAALFDVIHRKDHVVKTLQSLTSLTKWHPPLAEQHPSAQHIRCKGTIITEDAEQASYTHPGCTACHATSNQSVSQYIQSPPGGLPPAASLTAARTSLMNPSRFETHPILTPTGSPQQPQHISTHTMTDFHCPDLLAATYRSPSPPSSTPMTSTHASDTSPLQPTYTPRNLGRTLDNNLVPQPCEWHCPGPTHLPSAHHMPFGHEVSVVSTASIDDPELAELVHLLRQRLQANPTASATVAQVLGLGQALSQAAHVDLASSPVSCLAGTTLNTETSTSADAAQASDITSKYGSSMCLPKTAIAPSTPAQPDADPPHRRVHQSTSILDLRNTPQTQAKHKQPQVLLAPWWVRPLPNQLMAGWCKPHGHGSHH